jgi:DNA (cytosine-5)-methyltransferase 1
MTGPLRLRTVDMFCGGGGSSWGARAAGAEIVCGIDAWDVATRTFADNFPGALALNRRMDATTTPADLGIEGPVDLLLASPECTNHTCARGSRPRDEESRSTANYVLRFAEDLSPRWIVVENVIQMRSWNGYPALIEGLEDLGYVVRPEVVDAAAFGVPQTRRRLFLICDREGAPAPLVRTHVVEPRAKDVLDPDDAHRSTPLRTDRRAKGTLERAERAITALGEGIPFLIVYYGSDGAGGWQPLDRPLRTLTTLDRFGLVTWKAGTPMLRMLQVPELRRAMGFGADYLMVQGTRRDRIRLLGNGVCPPVMEAIVRGLIEREVGTLNVEPETSSPAPLAAE